MPARFNLRLGVIRSMALLIFAGHLEAGPPAGKRVEQPGNTDSITTNDPTLDELRLLSENISDAESAGDFMAALEAAKTYATLCEKWDGARPWELLDARRKVATLTRIAGWTAAEQAAWQAIRSKQQLAVELNINGKYEQAEALFADVLEYDRGVHDNQRLNDAASLAQSYSNSALNLYFQAQFVKAQPFFDTALSLRLKTLGEDHPESAAGYLNCGENLRAQGRFQQAQAWFEKAVKVQRKLRGETAAETATAYNSLALCLAGQGRFAEARPLYENALATLSQTRGVNHRDTATAYSNLAANLSAQGRYADAQPLFEKALAIFLRQQNPENRDTATAYNNLATILRTQGRHAEAQPDFEKALALRIRVLGPNHADTGQSHYNLAVNLSDQERYDEAQSHFEQALAIFRDRLTDRHADTAIGYLKLAGNLENQGRFREAQKYLEQTLAIRRDVFGEIHPDTAQGYHELALNLNYQGDFNRAADLWTKAADSFERVRLLIALSGLDRAVKTGEQSPLLFLAALHARRSQPQAAWERWESSLARGLLDDLAARPAGKLSPTDRQRQQDIRAEIRGLEVIRAVLAVPSLDKNDRDKQQERLHTEQLALQAKLSDFEDYLAKTYGVAEGQSYDLARIQQSLAPDTALISWLDIQGHSRAADPHGEHWGVIIRQQGTPLWVKLPGTGEQGGWTPDDSQLGQQLAGVLANPANRPLRHTAGQIRQLVKELQAQRIAPLEPYFTARDGLPVVKRLIVLPAPAMRAVPIELLVADQFTVSYAPSGTLLTWLVEQKRAQPHGEMPPMGLLAVGDPLFEVPRNRGGSDRSSNATRESFVPLPGTRVEVQAISKTFTAANLITQVFLGADASEERLEELAGADQLRKFRFLHFATHGVPDSERPMRSRIILSRSNLPDPRQQLLSGKPVFRGELTAEQVLNEWKLNADLVSLSACQSGLGQYAVGEGHLGFAQALLLSGAKSLLLSLWKVDDTATALLMARFYENVLGTRPGMDRPLTKAAALHEAKTWLRQLSAAEVAKLTSEWNSDSMSSPLAPAMDAANVPPFEHPAFWAAFVLIGAPE